jgi:hypothetical protein
MNDTATLVPALPAPPAPPPGSLAPLFTAIANITEQIGAVKKTGTNTFHNYAYATAADVMHALQPLIAQEGLVIIPSEKSRELMADCILAITYEFTIAHKSGAVLPDKACFTGMSALINSKGVADDKAGNKTLTAASKYFTINLFKIPTGDFDDADGDGDVQRQPTTAQSTLPKPAAQKSAAPVAEKPKAEPVAPSVDPATGEISPHMIMIAPLPGGEGATLIAWGQKFIASINTAKTATEIDAWVEANKKMLLHMENNAKAIRTRVGANIDATRAKLATAPADDPEMTKAVDPAAVKAAIADAGAADDTAIPGFLRREAKPEAAETTAKSSGLSENEIAHADLDEKLAACADLTALDGVWTDNLRDMKKRGKAYADHAASLFESHVQRIQG